MAGWQTLQAARANLQEVLKEGGRGTSTGRASNNLRVGLVVTQVALALALWMGILSQFVPERIPQQITVAFSKAPPILQVLAGAVGLAIINVLGPEGVAPFIYFQF